jgi:hypothetical protein
LVELLIPALALGLVQLRWGVLPAILIHFGYDFVLMSAPLFQTEADSLVGDRVVVLVLLVASVALPGVWGWWRSRQKPIVSPPLLTPSSADTTSTETVAGPVLLPPTARITAKTWALWGVLAVLGVVAVAALGTSPDLRLTVDRATAQQIATQALSDNGLKVPATAVLDVTVQGEVSDDDRYVRAQAGPAVAAELRKRGFLPPARWVFQWTDYDAPVEKRERWIVTVADTSGPRRVAHQVPAALPGETLGADEATQRALTAIGKRLDLPATTLKLVAALETEQPARLDWALDFEVDPPVAGLSLRVHADVSGGVVTDAYRLVFVPEDWSRNWQAESSGVGVVNGALLFLGFALMIWSVIRAAKAWTRGQVSRVTLVVLAAAATLAYAGVMLNAWGNQAVNFVLDQPWMSQVLGQLGAVLAIAVASAVQGFTASALVQPGSWRRPKIEDLAPALVAGLLWAGALEATTVLFPLGTSWAPDFSKASAMIPAINSSLNWAVALIAVVTMTFVLSEADRLALSSRWKPWVLIFVAGLIWHGGLQLDTWQTVLGRGLIGGVLACILWALVRGRPALVTLTLTVAGLAGGVYELGKPTYPGAGLDLVLGTLTGLALGWALAGLTIRTRVFPKAKD